MLRVARDFVPAADGARAAAADAARDPRLARVVITEVPLRRPISSGNRRGWTARGSTPTQARLLPSWTRRWPASSSPLRRPSAPSTRLWATITLPSHVWCQALAVENRRPACAGAAYAGGASARPRTYGRTIFGPIGSSLCSSSSTSNSRSIRGSVSRFGWQPCPITPPDAFPSILAPRDLRVVGAHVLEEEVLPARPEHAADLGQRPVLVVHRAEEERADDRVERAVLERQALDRALVVVTSAAGLRGPLARRGGASRPSRR